jgi:hypothetical protein
VRFTLVYQGVLPASGSPLEKQRIREDLHAQLKELWTLDPLEARKRFLEPESTEPLSFSILIERYGHVWAPLVCEKLSLRAHIDIRMLRPERPGGIVTSGGDIDNRLKTLFDALSMPQQRQQMTDTARPSSATHPTFTLLEDDKLISRIAVETDRWLAPPAPDHVHLTMQVALRAQRVIYANDILRE